MYSLEQLQGRIIWLLREYRVGSCWLSSFLQEKLNRGTEFFDFPDLSFGGERIPIVTAFFDNRKQKIDDGNKLLDTHEFHAAKSLKNYDNPIVIRIIRRNKTEQFISAFISYALTKVINVYTSDDITALPKLEPVIVPLNEIQGFINGTKQKQQLWEEYASLYENETLYYEDILQGCNSEIFDFEISMKDRFQNRQLPLKMPYNKKELIINYDEIDKMVREAFGNY